MFITLIADQIYGEIRVYKDRQIQLSLCCNGSGSNTSSSAGVDTQRTHTTACFRRIKEYRTFQARCRIFVLWDKT